jgi:hypothetical protein
VARARYLNNAKKITHVMIASPINNVLWPQRATVAIMFLSSNLHLSSTADRPWRPTSFMGAELYNSKWEQGMLQVSKTVFAAI